MPDDADLQQRANQQLKLVIGDLTMQLALLTAKVQRLEEQRLLAQMDKRPT